MTDDRLWWPEGYDLPAFRVKRVTYGETEGGDYVRGSSALTLPHTAVRYPTNSINLSALAPAMKGRLFVKASDFDQSDLYNAMSLDWNWPTAVEDTFVEMAIVRSAFGAPAFPEQGQTVFRAMRSYFPTEDDGETLLPPQTVYDRNLMPGHWYYYTAFFRTNLIDWTPIMSDSAALPGEYHHKDHLWNTMPPYYQFIDDNQGRSFLLNFMGILGYELDRTRQMVESLLDLHRIDHCPMPLLRGLGANYGYSYEAGLGDVLYRSLLSNISRLLTKRGTTAGVLGIVETVTKYDSDVTNGVNSVLLPDTSNFVTSIGQWKPAHPDLDLVTPVVADYVTWDKVHLAIEQREVGEVTGPPVAGAIGSMLIDTATADTGDVFITAGAGKYADDDGNITEAIPLHGGIPVHPKEDWGMSVWVKMQVPTEVILYFLPFDRLGKLTNDLAPIASPVMVPPDSDWFRIAHVGQMPTDAVYLVPAIYFRDRSMTGGLGGRTPQVAVGAVMVYRIVSEVPTVVTAPDDYLILGVAYQRMGEPTMDDGTGTPYPGFVIGAPVSGESFSAEDVE